MRHKKDAAKRLKRSWPHLSMDFGFLKDGDHAGDGDDRDPSEGVILAGMEAISSMVLGMLIPEKGAAEEWVAKSASIGDFLRVVTTKSVCNS